MRIEDVLKSSNRMELSKKYFKNKPVKALEFASPSYQLEVKKRNMAGKAGVGQTANHLTHHALAQEAGIIAIKNKSHLAKSKSIIKKESNFLKNKISKIPGFECHHSSTNFILIKTKNDSTKIQKRLLKHKILIRDCKNFRGLNNHYIRIAVKSHKDNLKLVAAMEAVA